MKITPANLVVITLLFLPVLLLGTKKWTDNKQRDAQMELQRIHPELEHIATHTKPYRFPLDSRRLQQGFASFNTAPRFPNLYHAAIDYYADVGEPVYAISDGVVSFSGFMRGYPGLVIIDHERDGLYSLYGHLSMKKPIAPSGKVKQGDILGYIADPSEAFGIGSHSHLHFSIRLGTREEYPQTGEERWMAGYTPTHPVFKRFIDPEKFILLTQR
ncbi:M23 family metallopeptidase [Vibrio sp. SCSIO 43136]|uniref:M23 family metallopeptidase n=1 Tax=Vibrio sp. SCSIO 43136 TaxID=2819101 RepID=UPI0020752C97|nr:M23 family metallopeptidase [Vibrio sp. SCSIO 43136]USD66147.1 M23 family metallopeptidase [Vibrio sp. SCSIO 43136]